MSAITMSTPLGTGLERGVAPRASRRPAGPSHAPVGLRLTARGRLVVWAFALAAAAGVVLSAQAAGADAPGAAQPVVTHVVAPGETLWQIAGGVVEPGQDRRDVVADLVELNRLDGAALQAGQEILVPRG